MGRLSRRAFSFVAVVTLPWPACSEGQYGASAGHGAGSIEDSAPTGSLSSSSPDGPADSTSQGSPESGGSTSGVVGTSGEPEAPTTSFGSQSESTGDVELPTEGEFSLLSYNVAGLPEGLSGSSPARNIPLISPLLNLYDVAVVQEDFAYHIELAAAANHPHQSAPDPTADPEALRFGDGLNGFSQFPVTVFERTPWDHCNGLIDAGADCLTSKGFFFATCALAPGVEVDVYNLHMDAKSDPGDVAARNQQVAQLIAHINARAAGRPIIVAGDTNMDEDPEDRASLVTLLSGAGLTDACQALACGDEDRIDRIMMRSSTTLELTPLTWTLDPRFVDEQGNDLSDHPAVGVTIAWRRIGGDAED